MERIPDFIGDALRKHSIDKIILRANKTGWENWGEISLITQQAIAAWIEWKKENK